VRTENKAGRAKIMISTRLAAIPHALADGFSFQIVHQAIPQTIGTIDANAASPVAERDVFARRIANSTLIFGMNKYVKAVHAKIQHRTFLRSILTFMISISHTTIINT